MESYHHSSVPAGIFVELELPSNQLILSLSSKDKTCLARNTMACCHALFLRIPSLIFFYIYWRKYRIYRCMVTKSKKITRSLGYGYFWFFLFVGFQVFLSLVNFFRRVIKILYFSDSSWREESENVKNFI